MTSGFMGIAFNFIRSVFRANAANQGQQSPAAAPHPNGWKVWFEDQGRSGKVGFKGEGRSLGFYWEFSGGEAIAIISVPTAEEWEAQTRIPLEKRLPILDYVGSETVRQKISTKSRYEIDADGILIYA